MYIKSYFDIIFLMYLVSSAFSFKPTSSSSSSSSTQFSQEWVRRKVVVKHSIKSNQDLHYEDISPTWDFFSCRSGEVLGIKAPGVWWYLGTIGCKYRGTVGMIILMGHSVDISLWSCSWLLGWTGKDGSPFPSFSSHRNWRPGQDKLLTW